MGNKKFGFLANLAMDPVRLRKLQVINQIRRLVKSGEDFTWVEILEHLGISELEYLEYGTIWRDIGSAGKVVKIEILKKIFSIFLLN